MCMAKMTTSQSGVDLIKEFEGFSAKAYKDQAGKWTIGYGTLIDMADEKVYLPNIPLNIWPEISKAEAEAFLRRDLKQFEDSVNQSVAVELNQNQFDALVSLVYNIGPFNFRKSTVLSKINAGADPDQIEYWWKAWDKVTDPQTGAKVKSNGLARRRSEELDLFFLRADRSESPSPQVANHHHHFSCPHCGGDIQILKG